MKKILVIGSGGAGKTTFSKRLSRRLNLPLIHLDAHYWKPGWTETPKDDWNKIVLKLCSSDEWVMDGNFASSLTIRLEQADTVVFLDYNRVICTYRVLKRVLLNYGQVRDDMGKGCKESFDFEFLKWVWNYPKKSRPRITSALSTSPQAVMVHTIKSTRRLNEFFHSL